MKKIIIALIVLFSTINFIYAEDFIIKDGVLEKCKVNKEILKIPDTVKKIGENAFNDLDKVRKLYISKNIVSCEYYPIKINEIIVDNENTTYYSKDGVLYNKDQTKIIKYPFLKQGTSFIIPDTVTYIKEDCFSFQNNLETIFISKNVSKIEGAFWSMMSIKAINVSDENKNFKSIEGVLFNRSIDKLLFYPCAKEGHYYTVPSGINTIGDYAFNWNLNLVEITLPDTVEIIEKLAFAFSELKSIVIPKNVKYIGALAFRESSLKKMTLKLNDYDKMDNFDEDWISETDKLEIIISECSDGSKFILDYYNKKATEIDSEGNEKDVTTDYFGPNNNEVE